MSFGRKALAASAHIIWGGNYFGLPPSGCWLSWDKVQEFSGADMELAYTTLKQPSKTFRMSRVEAYVGIDKAHPTQKPVEIRAWKIGFDGVSIAAAILQPQNPCPHRIVGSRAVLDGGA